MRSFLPATRIISISFSRASRTTSVSFSIAICNSAPAMNTAIMKRSAVPAPRRVLILGGGDGLAVREILKYPLVESITVVDLDPEMTRIFSSNPMLTKLNHKSLLSPRVQVINADAFPWVDGNADSFDFIVIDFPDPTNYSLGKLYTTAFYRAVSRHLSAQGFLVVQSTSPMFARDSFWCIAATLKQAGLRTYPYHVYVPSFG